MSHFAQVIDGIVQQIIVAEQDFIDTLPNKEKWIQTSYNTRENQHLLGGTPMRGNYAGIGYIYDSENDVFYPPKPYPSWVMNQSTWNWESPIKRPITGKINYWNENTKEWLDE